MNASVEIIGVRHHSPACARLVAARLRDWRPDRVLIEGPSDFNDRIEELQRPGHVAPVAIFSYYSDSEHTHHCYAPFSDYAPEWIALRVAPEIGAKVQFIDLPYWHEGSRGRAQVVGDADAARRHRARERALAQRLGLDDGDALWDHLFEQALPTDQLAARLATYFDELRAGELGDASDRARETYMAHCIAHARAEGGRVLVVCGGWHRPALLRLAESATAGPADLHLAVPPSIQRQGSFLIPYSDRRLEALGGYGAGVQSPAYYRWLYEHGAEGAAERALRAVVSRLRAGRQSVSTAGLVAATTRMHLLAHLRGHAQPLRVDVLDGLLDAMSSEALSAPPPWQSRGVLSMQDDPVLREALLALTGDTVGRLAPGTPLPPLVADVNELLERHALAGEGTLQLDRQRDAHRPRLETLWRLRVLRIPGFDYRGSSAPQAARQLGADQYPCEEWHLRPGDTRHVALVEAGAYGPTLQAAALRRLRESVADAAQIDDLAELYVTALRAGYDDFGASVLPDLHAAVLHCTEHGPLGRAGLRLFGLLRNRLGPSDSGVLLLPALDAIVNRVLWLLEGLSAPNQPASTDDVVALQLVDRVLGDDAAGGIVTGSLLDTLHRLGGNADLPPSARGATFGVLWRHAPVDAVETPLLAAVKAYAHGEPLGDFLFGLFALARTECARSSQLLGVLDGVVSAMTEQEFLVAAPALRQAFHYFPPRERAQIGMQVAQRHREGDHVDSDWMRLPCSIDDLRRSARLLASIERLRTRFGL
ncbi:DUF5682 family protein [Tahibacter amnicola]|uniref:DUF5682 family protein n=1 Tax=Tahibacter amnicola TaxID=2976241 RepID=A0ABY6BBD9_9GAMM|nr:DUF5682 family protein [Tahibacter amnicola]UXI67014.1 DUF5682 family protein [Tahibacter amnicola]